MEPQSDLNNERLTETIRRLMEENYDLGKLTRAKEILGGYCNKNYAVWMSANDRAHRYFLRLYNPNVIENEILFEHALLNHLRSNGFTLAAAIVPCRNGATVVHSPPPENHRGRKALWALFEFLEGEDKYSWTCTDLTDKEFISAAEILAHLHHCGHGFKKPPGADRVQPRIMEFIPTFKKTFSAFLEQADDRRCDRLFKDNFEPICNALDYAVSFDVRFQGMQKIPIHSDYHPGNLKFRDEKGVGIFDFDWSKIDYRLFDVALGLVYFTSIWDDQEAGLRPDKFTLFTRSYNEACHRLFHINPLTRQEQRYLVPMLSIANLYVLNWDLVDFYGTLEPDDDEYYRYMDHNIGLMHWIAVNREELELWVKNTLNRF
jgi:homoserine kinase type II